MKQFLIEKLQTKELKPVEWIEVENLPQSGAGEKTTTKIAH